MSSRSGSRSADHLELPTREQLAQYAHDLNLPASDDDIEECLAAVATIYDDIHRLEELGAPSVPLRHPERDPGRTPTDSEDPYHAIVRFCDVKGADTGPLAGMHIGVKDHIPVAGIPVSNGNAADSAPTPTEDAAAVERLLDAGASITAKTTIGGSIGGPARNPLNPAFSPGFSSSGSGAAVAAGMVDAALGTDIAGSVRIPAAWCGIVAIKATHGLVPSCATLAGPNANQIGPITTTVTDNATMLEVMAGPDYRDPHHADGLPPGGGYISAADQGIDGLRIGFITEAAQPSICTPAALAALERAKERLSKLGAELAPVSVPLWNDAAVIMLTLTNIAAFASTPHWLGLSLDYHGRVDEPLHTAIATRDVPDPRRTLMSLLGEHLRRQFGQVSPIARAQNLRVELRRQVNLALAGVDVLVTPTMVVGPHKLDEATPGLDTAASRDLLNLQIRNTCPLNLSGHPALSVPSGPGDDNLPTGLQIIGRKLDEYTVYRAGFAFEATSPQV